MEDEKGKRNGKMRKERERSRETSDSTRNASGPMIAPCITPPSHSSPDYMMTLEYLHRSHTGPGHVKDFSPKPQPRRAQSPSTQLKTR